MSGQRGFLIPAERFRHVDFNALAALVRVTKGVHAAAFLYQERPFSVSWGTMEPVMYR